MTGAKMALIVEDYFDDFYSFNFDDSSMYFVSPTQNRKSINKAWKAIQKRTPDRKVFFSCSRDSENAFSYRFYLG